MTVIAVMTAMMATAVAAVAATTTVTVANYKEDGGGDFFIPTLTWYITRVFYLIQKNHLKRFSLSHPGKLAVFYPLIRYDRRHLNRFRRLTFFRHPFSALARWSLTKTKYLFSLSILGIFLSFTHQNYCSRQDLSKNAIQSVKCCPASLIPAFGTA